MTAKIVLFFIIVMALISTARGMDQASNNNNAVIDEAWDKDLDKKLDKTIKVLEVLKGELKDIKKEEINAVNAAVSGNQDEEVSDWSETLKKSIDKTKKVWGKLKKAVGKEDENLLSSDLDGKNNEELKKEFSQKLDKTIKAMKVIKEELDKEPE